MPELSEQLAAKLRELPDSPGVYQMKGERGRIIYVGKAKSLKHRAASYFTDGARFDMRIAQLVTKIRDIDWVVVPSEVDALMLESSLIRQFRPHYNTMLKDDKSYPYVKITTNELYPRVMLTRRYLDDRAKYWGPMTNVTQVRRAVRFIANLFQIRTCTLEIDGKKFFTKPCLDYHLKLCSAPCVNYIPREEYRKLTSFAVDFFNGNYRRVLAELKRRMAECAENREYENAARYRDLITSIEKSFERTRMIGKPEQNMDIIGIARSKDRACVMLMPVRDGRLLGEQSFMLNHRMEDSADDDVLSGFLKLHYANPLNIPPEIVLPYEPPEMELLAEWMSRLRLRAQQENEAEAEEAKPRRRKKPAVPQAAAEPLSGADDPLAASNAIVDEAPAPEPPVEEEAAVSEGACTDAEISSEDGEPRLKRRELVQLCVPKRGGQFRELLDIARRNAEERMHTALLGSNEDYVITPGQRALAELLELPDFPRRIEGYDIANLQGKQATGAMVVFEGGRKAAREYRLFNIRLKDTPDDFAMLKETLSRRLQRLLRDEKWKREVDLIMIDGGKGQLSAAQLAVDLILASPEYSQEEKEQIAAIKLCSLAKQEELIYHYGHEGALIELRLPHDNPGLRLLVALRNEAHRYGNLQHTKMRDKVMTISVLDTIPGLGDARKQALVRHFGSAKRIREASAVELSAVPGIGPKYAERLHKYLERDSELEEGKAEIKREMRIRRIRGNGDAKNE